MEGIGRETGTSVRLRAAFGVASLFLAYAFLVLIWSAVAHQFWFAMAPRLSPIGEAGLVNDVTCGGASCDFSAFWPAGMLARAGRAAQAYDQSWFLAYRRAVFWDHAELVRWFYPPTAFLPVMAVSFLPFVTAFWVWTVALTGLAIWLLRRARLSWDVIGLGMLSPAALWNIEIGQFGTVTGALVVTALLLMEEAPVKAGFWLGWLVIKPQAGILAGVAMLTRRRYSRAAVAAWGVAVALGALVTVATGWRVWPVYFDEGLAVSKTVLQAVPPAATYYESFGVSVFWALHIAGLGLKAAYAAQLVVALISAAVVFWVWRRGWGDVLARMSLTVFCSLLATPYGYTDDMVGYSIALAACAARRRWRIDVFDALFFLWPALCPVVFLRTGMLFTPLVVVAAAARLVWRQPGDAPPAAVVTGG